MESTAYQIKNIGVLQWRVLFHVIASLRSYPESDRCTWIASQARNDGRYIPSFTPVWFFHWTLAM